MAWWSNGGKRSWGVGNSDATAPSLPAVARSFERDPHDVARTVRILPPRSEGRLELPEGHIVHVAAQYLAEGRAQVAEYAATASSAVREILAEARARRFEAVQQAKARRLMLESYRAALQRQADAQRILGPHVRYSGRTGRTFWITLFLIGDAAGMTLALTYGGESPVVAAIMALAVGAAVVVCGKTGEDLRRESLIKNLEFSEDPETKRFVDAVFGVNSSSQKMNRRVLYAFVAASSFAGIAITVYRSVEESLGVGLAFGLWALLIGAGSFAASWVYYDPAKSYINLTEYAVDDAERIWRSTEIDAIEDHNAGVEAARHIIGEHRQRAEAAWNMSIAGAVAAMAANSDLIGVSQHLDYSLIQHPMPDVPWPDLTGYYEIVDRDDVSPDAASPDGEPWMLFAEDGTNRIARPTVFSPLGED